MTRHVGPRGQTSALKTHPRTKQKNITILLLQYTRTRESCVLSRSDQRGRVAIVYSNNKKTERYIFLKHTHTHNIIILCYALQPILILTVLLRCIYYPYRSIFHRAIITHRAAQIYSYLNTYGKTSFDTRRTCVGIHAYIIL